MDEMASTAIQLSRGAREARMTRDPTSINIGSTNSFRPRGLFRARVDYQIQIWQALGGLLPISARSVARPVLHVEYEPWIRQMVAGDEMQEQVYLCTAGERGGRTTRNSQRYVRMVSLTAEGRDALRETAWRG